MNPDQYHRILRQALEALGLGQKERLLVFNKQDLVDPEIARALARRFDALTLSALDKDSFEALELELERRVFARPASSRRL